MLLKLNILLTSLSDIHT